MSTTTLTLGSRESQLAMIQSTSIQSQLQHLYPLHEFGITSMSTQGDFELDKPLYQTGKSLFTKELELSLESHVVDIVVHSLKDLPTTLPTGMGLAVVTERVDPRDCLIVNQKHRGKTLLTLGSAIIGTSSVRRIAQLKRLYPHLVFKDIRGNLNTRLKKLDFGAYDGIILAAAGVIRMGWTERIEEYLDTCYAVGQGSLGIECRLEDLSVQRLLAPLDHLESRIRCEAERSFMRELEGGCSVPLGVKTVLNGDLLSFIGCVTSLDGDIQLLHTTQGVIRGTREEKIASAVQLGIEVAYELKRQGAVELLAGIRAAQVVLTI